MVGRAYASTAPVLQILPRTKPVVNFHLGIIFSNSKVKSHAVVFESYPSSVDQCYVDTVLIIFQPSYGQILIERVLTGYSTTTLSRVRT